MEKLYEEDAFLDRFSAVVESCKRVRKGWDVILDRTAFYPEGGGQPWDTGTLGGTQVLEVRQQGGRVVHTCAAPLDPGTAVEGIIDWARRFDLMQNHSGEHIVSGLAHRFWGCENVGFHMGRDVITVDLSVGEETLDLDRLEDAANRYIWEDHPAVISYPAPEELERLEYRSKKSLEWPVRIVSFPGADTCACCGIHVRSSGQVGLIKLLSARKFRQGLRLELVCGGRAVRHLTQNLEQNRRVSNLLSAKPLETARAVERLLGEGEELKSRLCCLQERQFSALAEQYRGAGDVLLFEPDLSPDAQRRLCDALLHSCGGLCACFSETEGGYQYALGQKDADLRELAGRLNRALNGRGGGKPGFVQGSVHCTREEIETFFHAMVSPGQNT